MIKTTRIKSTQAPRVETLDLSGQMNGSRTTFQLPRKIHVYDRHYLVWNSTVYRNDANHRFYSVGSDMQSVTVYFDEPPVGGPGRTLQLAVDMSGDGDDLTVSKGEFDEAIENINSQMEAEETARQEGDATVKAAVDAEADARAAADTAINARIEEIINSPDVRYIKESYADLEAIDKSTIGDQDYARVLVDETHANNSTFYQFHKDTQSWEYIGVADAGYTKSETDAKFATKSSVSDAISKVTDKYVISANDTANLLESEATADQVSVNGSAHDSTSGTSSTATLFSIAAATTTTAGLMSASDKQQISKIPEMETDISNLQDAIAGVEAALVTLDTGEGV